MLLENFETFRKNYPKENLIKVKLCRLSFPRNFTKQIHHKFLKVNVKVHGMFINLFHATVSFYIPLKHQKTRGFF